MSDIVRGVRLEDQEATVEYDDNYKNIVIVDNIPIVDAKRYDRLSAVINKIFAGFGKIKELHIPQAPDGDQKTYGYTPTPTLLAKPTFAFDKGYGAPRVRTHGSSP